MRRKDNKRELWKSLLNTPSLEPVDRFRFIWILLITIIFHLFIAYMLPEVLLVKSSMTSPSKNMEVVFEPFQRFVEANPEVVIKEPFKTPNFSDRSQVAAQKKPDVNNTGIPFVDGEFEDFVKIVAENSPSLKPLTSIQVTRVYPFFKQELEPEIANGVSFKHLEPSEEAEEEHLISLTTHQLVIKEQQKPRRPTPKPRPIVKSKVVPHVSLMKNVHGVARLGHIAVDARQSGLGDYLKRLFELISYQWSLLLTAYPTFTNNNTRSSVVITFSIDKMGEIHILKVESTNASTQAVLLCKDAICSLAPYERWSPEMIQLFGEKRLISLTFPYL